MGKRVSVCIPTYDGAKYIKEYYCPLKVLRSCLNLIKN